MLHQFIDRFHRVIGGGALLGEITTFLTGDRLQQLGFLLTGVLAWGSHYWWSQRANKRNDHDADAKSARVNLVLDALARKFVACIEEGKPFPLPELLHLIIDRPEIAAIVEASQVPVAGPAEAAAPPAS